MRKNQGIRGRISATMARLFRRPDPRKPYRARQRAYAIRAALVTMIDPAPGQRFTTRNKPGVVFIRDRYTGTIMRLSTWQKKQQERAARA